MGHSISEGLRGVAFILALFACVVVHEFGHALTAKRFGVKTKDITLYPIGGIASLESMPEKPSQELLVASVGPAINLVIAFVIWLGLKFTGKGVNLSEILNFNYQEMSFASSLFSANIILALFNLIPAFPMDGGRVLRSALAMFMDPLKATSIASRAGQFLAIIFVFFGFFYNFWLVFIGLFIFLGAGAEVRTEEIKHFLEGVRVEDVMMTNFSVLNPDTTVESAAGNYLNSNEKSFVIMDGNNVSGILGYKTIIEALHKGIHDTKIREIMQKEFVKFKCGELVKVKLPLLQRQEQSLFPVLCNDQLVGVISLENLQKWIQTRPDNAVLRT